MTSEDGQRLYELIYPQLKSAQTVELDFAGVEIFASPFFNFGLGKLFADIPEQDINEHLNLLNLNVLGQDVWECVRENAREYYSNADHRKAVDRVIQDQAEQIVSV
ncbi:MAG: STAS-like domain-containing protein [Spirulinaceae cyanobacterium]